MDLDQLKQSEDSRHSCTTQQEVEVGIRGPLPLGDIPPDTQAVMWTDRGAGPPRTLVALGTQMQPAGTQALIAAGTQALLAAGNQALVGTRAVAGIQGPWVGTLPWAAGGRSAGRGSGAGVVLGGAWRRRDTFPQMLHT